MTGEGDNERNAAAKPRLPRPAGTYAAHYERGANAGTGRNRLVAFTLASVALETVWLLLTLRGISPWSGMLVPGTRVLMTWILLVALWSGAGWTRWALAAICFGFGGWLTLHALISGLGIYLPFLPTPAWFLARMGAAAVGSLYLVAAAWFAFSADLEAFIVRQRAGMTRGDRWAVAGLLALCLGLPLAGTGLWAANRWVAASEEAAIYRQAQRDGAPGGEFALGLVREAVRRDDFSVLATGREGRESRLRTDFEAAGRILRVDPGDVLPIGDPQAADGFLCKVIVVGEQRRIVFCCYVHRQFDSPGWRLEEASPE